MKLSTRGRYGTRLMLELSKNYGNGPISMSDISRNQDIPHKYLEQIIIPLKKADLIQSFRGSKGGHSLSRDPSQISLWDVLIHLETNLMLVDCVGDQNACEHSGECPVRPVWGKAHAAMANVFKETSLEDVLASKKQP